LEENEQHAGEKKDGKEKERGEKRKREKKEKEGRKWSGVEERQERNKRNILHYHYFGDRRIRE